MSTDENEKNFQEFWTLLTAYLELHEIKETNLSTLLRAPSYVNKVKTRRSMPGMKKMIKIADTLGVTVADLTPGADIPKSLPPGVKPLKEKIQKGEVFQISEEEFEKAFFDLLKAVKNPSLTAKAKEAGMGQYANECVRWVNELLDGKTVTSRLSQYLLIALSGATGGRLDEFPPELLKKASLAVAQKVIRAQKNRPNQNGASARKSG